MSNIVNLLGYIAQDIGNARSILMENGVDVNSSGNTVSALYNGKTITVSFQPNARNLNPYMTSIPNVKQTLDAITRSSTDELANLLLASGLKVSINASDIYVDLNVTYPDAVITISSPTQLLANTIINIADGSLRLEDPLAYTLADGRGFLQSRKGSRIIQVSLLSPQREQSLNSTSGLVYLYILPLDEIYRLLKNAPFQLSTSADTAGNIDMLTIEVAGLAIISISGNPYTSSGGYQASTATQPVPVTFLGNIGSKRIPIPSPNHQLGRMFLHKWKSA